jgi:superfamily II DNA helicase RecQ
MLTSCTSRRSQFRPDYRDLANIKDDYPGTPVMALTATANHQVRDDIVRLLRMQDCVTVSSSFNRTNLFYEIRPKSKKVTEEIAAFIQADYPTDCGIIYASSRDGCEKIAKDLRDKYHVNASHYHAGMSKDDRAWTQAAWQSGEIKVIVATVSTAIGFRTPHPPPVPRISRPIMLTRVGLAAAGRRSPSAWASTRRTVSRLPGAVLVYN